MPSKSQRSIVGYKARLIERIGNLEPGVAQELRSIKLPWYHIRNVDTEDGEETAAELFIYDEIGGSLGVSADDFVKDLQAITAKKIDVRINSPGGSVFDSIAIYNALVKHPAHVTTYVDALAASGASIVAMAGDECVVMVGGQLMIHDALGLEMGNAADMREMAKFLDRQSDNIASIYAAKAGGDIAEWRAMMLAETWMFAQEAVDLGLADKVYMRPSAGVGAEENVPDEDDPMMPEPEDGEDDEEDDPNQEESIDALMRAHHRLTNRGFKYTGRIKAPKPVTAHSGYGSLAASYLSNLT